MLKVAQADANVATEMLALTTWGGRGGDLLPERLDERQSTQTLNVADGFTMAAQLLRQLAVPAPATLPRVPEFTLLLAAELPIRWERLG